MFAIFGKSRKQDGRDLEQVLFDIAEHRTDKDFGVLFERMKNRHVFVPADPSTFPQTRRLERSTLPRRATASASQL